MQIHYCGKTLHVPDLEGGFGTYSRNRHQHCFKILWSLIFAQAARSIGGQWLLPWASAAWPCLARASHSVPANRFHFRLYFFKKDQIARRREWFLGCSPELSFDLQPSESPDPCSQCCVFFLLAGQLVNVTWSC